MTAPVTRHLSILLTDIKGFTDKTSHKTRADIQSMLDEHRSVVLPILEHGGGVLIKTIGDAFLMTFESPTNAVLAGLAVQEALAKLNAGRASDDRLDIRIAINAGEVNLVEGDVFGEPVNITARIEGIAEAGQVYFTEAVYLAMNKAEVPSSEVGLMQLKGIPEKIRVYKVRREDPLTGASTPAPERSGLRRFLPPAAASAPVFSDGVKAVPVSATALPKSWRRAVALVDDWIICLIILSFFTGQGWIHVSSKRPKTPAAPGISLSQTTPAVALGAPGFPGLGGVTTISVGEGRPQKVALDAGRMKITVDDEDADADSFWDRVKRGRWHFAIVWAVYNMVFLKWLGATPGKRVMKLRVISQNGAPLDKRQRWLRSVFSVFSFYAFLLGYVWALWEPQRRTWHDLVAGTRVVPAE
ncbi:MAG: RDD family protein [Elusimicrobiota bacterium]